MSSPNDCFVLPPRPHTQTFAKLPGTPERYDEQDNPGSPLQWPANYITRYMSSTEESGGSPPRTPDDGVGHVYGNSLGVQATDITSPPISSASPMNSSVPSTIASPDTQLDIPIASPVESTTLDTSFGYASPPTTPSTPIPSADTDNFSNIDSDNNVNSADTRSANSDSNSTSGTDAFFPISVRDPTCSNTRGRRYSLLFKRYSQPKDSDTRESLVTPTPGDSGCLSPGVTPSGGPPAFPAEPTILAEKYVVMGSVDTSTAYAVQINNNRLLHIKSVSPRTAREVASQQAVLGESGGVRSPLEIVTSSCGRQSWLVFPRHFGDLHSYVRLRRRLREAEAQRLFGQVASTVDRCHSAGLVLRDLKLRKFVFTDSTRQDVVLESVEDSVLAGEGDLLHDKHGCPAYVAPEILTSSAYSGRHADMWGLGVILYTMLVGRYPFHNPDTSTLFAYIRSGKFTIPNWVSSRARHLIMSLLRRVPNKRLSAKQVLAHPWLTRAPRDHNSKDQEDHVVPTFPSSSPSTQSGKACPPYASRSRSTIQLFSF